MINKELFKGFIAGLSVALLITTSVQAIEVEKQIKISYSNIKVYIDGVLATLKDANGDAVEPFVYEGTSYLPLRSISNLLGKEVNWDGNTNSIYIGEKDDNINEIDYSSLKEGIEKEYVVLYNDSSGNKEQGKAIVSNSSEVIGGKKYIKKTMVYDGISLKTDSNYYRKEKYGIYRIEEKYKDRPEFMDIPLSLTVGKSWIVNEMEQDVHYNVVSKEDIKLPNNLEFKECLRINYEAKKNDQILFKGYFYLAPNVGNIKSVYEFESSTIELYFSK